MVFSLHQCPGVEGKVCNLFLSSKENDPRRLCCACRGKTCNLDDHCEECYDWLDDRCKSVSDYMVKLSLQQEKCERKAEASSLSFSGFSPSMPVPMSAAIACRYWFRDHQPFGYGVCGDFLSHCSVCAACGRYSVGAGPQAASCRIAQGAG